METVQTNSFKAWVLAARPKTLTAATIPVMAGCALAYAAGACFGNSMYYTTPYFYMFLGMMARTIKLKNTK